MTKKIILSSMLLALALIMISGCCGGGGSGSKTTTTFKTCNVTGVLSSDILTLAGSGNIKITAPQGEFGSKTETFVSAANSGEFTLSDVRTSLQTIVLEMPDKSKYTYTLNIPEKSDNLLNMGTIAKSDLTKIITSKWSLLIYMAADNNLSYSPDASTPDLTEMKAATVNNQDLQILIFLDEMGRDVYIQRVINGKIETLFNLSRVNSGSAGIAKEFFSLAADFAPANHYIVDIWNHGSGWDTTYDTAATSRSIAIDSTSGAAIKIADLPYALEPLAPIDILITDACLMGCVEVICELDKSIKYFIASPDQTPVAGLQYTNFINKIGANVNDGAEALARKLFTIAEEANSTSLATWKPKTALYDLSKAYNFASALNIYIADNPTKKLTNTYNYYTRSTGSGVYKFDVPSSNCSMYDLMEFVETGVGSDNVRTALDALVLEYGNNDKYPLRTLGAFFPDNNNWSGYSSYGELVFSKLYAPNWYNFIKTPRGNY